MDTAQRSGRSWLAGLLLVVLAICGGALVKSFWSMTQLQPVPPATTDTDDDHLPSFSVDEGLQVLADPDASSLERAAAIKVVSQEGIKAVPKLAAMLDSPSAEARISAAALLGGMGPAASEAGPRLRELCADPDPHVRTAVVTAALNVHPDREVLREALLKAMKLGPDAAADPAMAALAEMDPPPVEDFYSLAATNEKAISYLVGFAESDPALLRRMLKDHFRFRGTEALRGALEDLVRSETDDAVHLRALLALVSIPDPSSPHRVTPGQVDRYRDELLAAAARHRDSEECSELIFRLGVSAERNLPALIELTKSSVHRTRCEAAFYVAPHVRKQEAVYLLPLLREALRHDVIGTDYAIQALQRLDPAAREAIPELTALAERDTYNGGVAKRALEKLSR